MSTITTTPRVSGFDLDAAIRGALPDWSEEEWLGLAEAIRRDSAEFVRENAAGCDMAGSPLELVQQQMLQQVVESVAPPADQADNEKLPFRMNKLDLVAAVGEVVSFLPHEAWPWVASEVYPCLETMVGEHLTDGLPDEMLDEFGFFVDMNEEGMAGWLSQHDPAYEQDPLFLALVKANADAPRLAITSEYGAMKWLQLNRPDYPTVVAQTTTDLMNALRNLVAETGEDVFETWARVQDGWVQVMKHASDAHEVLVGMSHLVGRAGGPAMERWASVEESLCALDERADAMREDGAR